MGDRANIQIQEADGGKLFLYAHWDGDRLPALLATALKRGQGRWDDETYLSRIIFSEMIQNSVLDETGYGLSTYRGDYNYDDLIVDMANKTVIDREGVVYSFSDYAKKYSNA